MISFHARKRVRESKYVFKTIFKTSQGFWNPQWSNSSLYTTSFILYLGECHLGTSKSFAPHRSHTCCCALTVPVLISWNTHIPWLLLPEHLGIFFFFSVIQVIREKTCLSREFTAAQWCACKAEDTQEGRTLPTVRAQLQITLSCNCTFSVWAILQYLRERKIGLGLGYLKCRLHCCPVLLVCIFLRMLSPSFSSQGACSLPLISLLPCLHSAS